MTNTTALPNPNNNTVSTVKTTADGSRLLSFNGIDFWVSRDGLIGYIPSNDWSVIDSLVSANLVSREFSRHLYGHVTYTLKG